MSRDITCLPHLEGMQIYGQELLVLCHYNDKSCDHKRCDGENIMFLNCPRSLVVKACLKYYENLRVKARRVSHHLIGPVQVEILNI